MNEFRRLIAQYGEHYSTATIYIAFAAVSAVVAVVLFGIIHSTGVMKLVFSGAVEQAEFTGAFAGFMVTLIFLVRSYNLIFTSRVPTIRGNVYSNGNPVEDAIVFVEGVDRQKRTDSTGYFAIEVNNQDFWVVRAHSDKGNKAQETVKRADAHRPIRLVLDTDSELRAISPEPTAIDTDLTERDADQDPFMQDPDPLLLDPDRERRSLYDHQISFSKKCKEDMQSLHLEEQSLLNLVAQEFTNHVNYFLYDLEDYVMPIREGFLVFLDKVNDKITFQQIVPATTDSAKLSSWEDILALYRRASRLRYRKDKEAILKDRRMYSTANRLHEEIERRIEKHFQDFEDLRLNYRMEEAPSSLTVSDPSREEIVGRSHNKELFAREAGLLLSQSERARNEADIAYHDLENNLIDIYEGLVAIVLSLDRSLQYLHKIIIRFPPT